MSDNCTVAPANGRITGTQIRIVAVVVLGAFLALLNQTVMSPALPVIMSDFAILHGPEWVFALVQKLQRRERVRQVRRRSNIPLCEGNCRRGNDFEAL